MPQDTNIHYSYEIIIVNIIIKQILFNKQKIKLIYEKYKTQIVIHFFNHHFLSLFQS